MRGKRMRWFGAVLAAWMLVLAGCATLDEQQRKWIFQPSKDNWHGATAVADGMQDRWIEFTPPGADAPVKLHALWLPQANPDAPVMLYLHGARWGVTSSSFRMRRLHAMGVSVLGIDYRGFGLSTDALPSETTAYEDARAAWDWLRQQQPKQQRVIYGHSLGSAIAVHLAAEVDDEAGVVIEGGFTSVPDVFATMRFGWLPLGPLITQRFDAAQRIAEVGSPVLVVHGAQDRMIQPALGRALYDRAREPKRFILANNGTHHNAQAMVSDQVRDAMHSLFGLPGEPAAAE
ncbi:MAG: alpha/beta hydrolase [Burkholderiales bacterium]